MPRDTNKLYILRKMLLKLFQGAKDKTSEPDAAMLIRIMDKCQAVMDEAAATIHPDFLEEHCIEDCAEIAADEIWKELRWEYAMRPFVRVCVDEMVRELGVDYQPLPDLDAWKTDS